MPAVHSLSHKWRYPCHVRNRFPQQRSPLGRHTPASPKQQQQQKHITPLNSGAVTEQKREETTQANESQTIKSIYGLSSDPEVWIFEDFPGWSTACIYFTRCCGASVVPQVSKGSHHFHHTWPGLQCCVSAWPYLAPGKRDHTCVRCKTAAHRGALEGREGRWPGELG